MKQFVRSCLAQLLFLLIVVWIISDTQGSEDGRTRDDLPYNVQPTAYLLKLKPMPEEDMYVGFVKISLLCLSNTSSIKLHADPDLFIPLKGVYVREPGATRNDVPLQLPVLSLNKSIQTSQLTVTLGSQLQQWATYELKIHFSGKLVSSEEWGLFKGKYRANKGGYEKWYLGTRLMPGMARKMFPCFDGTEYKATFSISVARPSSSPVTVLASTERRSLTKMKGDTEWLWENFYNTPRMLPSSIGLAMFELEELATSNDSALETKISVYGTRALTSHLEKVLEDFVKLFTFLNTYLERTIPLDKLDIIVFPGLELVPDRNAWGLIFMSDYLITNDWSALYGLVDQWFRHFSTPLDHDSPLLQALHKVLLWQSGLSVWKPIDHLPGLLGDESTSKKITQQYEWLLRMLNYSMSPGTFRKGLRYFIGDRQEFAIYTDNVLWYFMSESGHSDRTLPATMTVQDIAYSWVGTDHATTHDVEVVTSDDVFSWSRTDQEHILTESNIRMDRMPVVTVTRSYNNNTATVKQHVFVRRRMFSSDRIESFWWIPVLYLTQSSLDPRAMQLSTWMRGESEVSIGGLPSKYDFIIVNPEYTGLYVVNYDYHNWKLLVEYLKGDKFRNIPELTRSKLLYDSWNLAYFGELGMETALNMSLFLQRETSLTVWKTFLDITTEFLEYVSDTPVEPLLERYILRQLLAAQESGADWVSYSLLCRYGYEPCIADFREAFKYWVEHDDLEYKLTYNQFCYTFKYGNMEEYEAGIKFLTSHEATDKWNYSNLFFLLQALAICPVQEEKINRYFDVIFVEKNGNFSLTDIMTILIRYRNHAQGRWMAFLDFVSHNFASVKDRVKKAPEIWNLLITEVTRHFITQEGLNEVVAFHKKYKGQFGTAEPFIQSAKYKIASEVDWSSKNLKVMEQWLMQELRG